ncbi:MAG: prolyl oligopeptidase family serine peptidase [Planctomycetaceae bacterium]|nr:prolyl oligopeptidase family serine peptidase [Planctomycetaceae bacterium]
MMQSIHFLKVLSTLVISLGFAPLVGAQEALPPLREVEITSSEDGTQQPLLEWAPVTACEQPTPVLLFLHSWSGNYRQNNQKWHAEAVNRGWIFLHPDFRGPNSTPEACGSRLARRDILDALEYIRNTYQVDASRVYLAGASGGGHMALLMAAYHPEKFSAVSAWVPISDLSSWHAFHTRDGKPGNYARMMEKALSGPPGSHPEVDAQYHERSPIHHLDRAVGLPLHIHAGIHDGYTGSVPIDHSLKAYNVLAQAAGEEPIADDTIQALLAQGKLPPPSEPSEKFDALYEREIHFHRQAGSAFVTIFEGGHEGLSHPACAWLELQQRETK